MISIHRRLITSRPARASALRSFGVAAAAVLVTTAVPAQAQPPVQRPSIQRVQQAAAPAEGTSTWGQDNCFYVFQSGAWRSADYCRVMVTATVYDTYKPSTRTAVSRIDESQPGWIGVRDAATGVWFKFATNGAAILQFDGRQWVDVTAMLRNAAQQQQAANASHAATVAKNKANPALQAQIAQMYGMVAASQARQAGMWTAPNCTASYNGCQ
jgi:hypothetical protein